MNWSNTEKREATPTVVQKRECTIDGWNIRAYRYSDGKFGVALNDWNPGGVMLHKQLPAEIDTMDAACAAALDLLETWQMGVAAFAAKHADEVRCAALVEG